MKLYTKNIDGKTICLVQNIKEEGQELLFIYDNKPLFQYEVDYNTDNEVIKIDRFNYCIYKDLIVKLLDIHFDIISIDIIELVRSHGNYQKVDGYYIIFDCLN